MGDGLAIYQDFEILQEGIQKNSRYKLYSDLQNFKTSIDSEIKEIKQGQTIKSYGIFYKADIEKIFTPTSKKWLIAGIGYFSAFIILYLFTTIIGFDFDLPLVSNRLAKMEPLEKYLVSVKLPIPDTLNSLLFSVGFLS